MSDYDNDNQGAAWANDKRKEDWQAPFTGTAMVNGTEYFLDVFVTPKEELEENPKKPRVRIKLKQKQKQKQAEAPKSAQSDDFGLDVPF